VYYGTPFGSDVYGRDLLRIPPGGIFAAVQVTYPAIYSLLLLAGKRGLGDRLPTGWAQNVEPTGARVIHSLAAGELAGQEKRGDCRTRGVEVLVSPGEPPIAAAQTTFNASPLDSTGAGVYE
jgi:hypothetical protein